MKEARRRFVSLALVAALFSGPVTVEAKDKAKVIADKANVMLGEKVIAVLAKGAEFEIIGRHQQWLGLRVNVDGKLLSGWIQQRDCQVLAAGGMLMTFGAGDTKKTVPIPHLLAVVRAKGINQLVANAQQMAMEINPMLAGFVSAQGLAQGLGWQGMQGVDGDAPLALLLLNPDKFDEPAVGLIPVTDYDQFSQVGGPSPRNLGKFAMVGESAEAMDAVAGALEGISAIPIDDMKGDLEVRVDMNAAMKALEPHLDDMMSEMNEGLSMMGQMGGGSMDPEALGTVVKAEVDWLLNMARESSEAAFSLSMSKEGVRTNTSLTAKEGAKLAQWFSSVPAASHKLASLLPAEEALMTFSGEVGNKGWTDLYLDILEKLLPAFKVGTEDGKKVVDSARTLMGAMDGSMAGVMDMGKDGITGVFCMGAKGGADLKTAMRDAMKSIDVGRLNEVYKQMGMPMEFRFQPAARTSNGVEIDVFEYALKGAEGGNENPIMQQQMKMMSALYGDKVTYEIACLDKMILMVVGKDGSQTMDKLIPRANQLAAGGSMPAAIQSAQKALGADGQFYGAFSLKRMVGMVEAIMSAMMPAMGGGAAPGGPAVQIPGPPIGFCGKAKGNRAELECFIPVKPFGAIQAYFMQKAQQMQQQGGGAPGGGDPPPMTF